MNGLAIVCEGRLRAAGMRLPHQRRLVLCILAQAGGHLDACEVHEQARREDTRLSLTTVYRTLGTLRKAGREEIVE